MIDASVDPAQIGRERHDLSDFLTKLVDCQPVFRTNDGVREFVRRRLLQGQVFFRAQAGIDREHDRKRHRRLAAEDRNLLIFTVFLQYKIFFLETRNGATVSVRHGYKNVHQFNVNFEGGLRILRNADQCGGTDDQGWPKYFHAGTIIWMRAARQLCRPAERFLRETARRPPRPRRLQSIPFSRWGRSSSAYR